VAAAGERKEQRPEAAAEEMAVLRNLAARGRDVLAEGRGSRGCPDG
jgi:hypothetical protein